MSSSRQLAAIMFAYIFGYTALMGHAEQKAEPDHSTVCLNQPTSINLFNNFKKQN